jgi:hypothetical protein
MQLNPVELEKQLLLESTRATSYCFVDQKLMHHWFSIPVQGHQIYFPGNDSETNSSYSVSTRVATDTGRCAMQFSLHSG